MTVLTRSEFIDYFRKLDYRIDGTDPLCPLWVPEEEDNITCHWFVQVPPLGMRKIKSGYYRWCHYALQGQVRCFSSDLEAREEWWGFTVERDITIWMLKWAYD